MTPHATDSVADGANTAAPTFKEPEMSPSFVLRAVKDVAFEDRPRPKLTGEHDVLVHVAQTGICGSDVHYWQRGRIGPYVLKSPMILGHESAGIVAEVGSSVTHLRPGDKVAMEPATPPHDGTLAKYYINASDYCYKLPDSIDLEEGAMVEPVAVAVSVATTAGNLAAKTVVVMGCGPIGILCQRVAKAYGAAKVIAVDVVQARLDLAARSGADATFLPPRAEATTDPIEHAEMMALQMKKDLVLGDGADVVLECSGAEACVQLAAYVAQPGATIVQAGMGKEVVAFPITTVCTQGLILKGSIRYVAGAYPAAIDLISRRAVEVKSLITHRFEFGKAEEAFELVRQGRSNVFKVMIQGVP